MREPTYGSIIHLERQETYHRMRFFYGSIAVCRNVGPEFNSVPASLVDQTETLPIIARDTEDIHNFSASFPIAGPTMNYGPSSAKRIAAPIRNPRVYIPA